VRRVARGSIRTPKACDPVRRVVLATRNLHKVEELRRVLAPYAVELVSLTDLPAVSDVVENGATFVENATLKARAVAAETGLTAVADDSGLEVDALNGMPGIFSARWAGRHGDDVANLRLVLAQIADVPDERRGAAFACAAAAAMPSGRVVVVEERLRGEIIHDPRCHNRFG
jgi:XTP/dITP diphosphohydrolase